MADIDVDRQPHRETKAVFRGKGRGRDEQPRLPQVDRRTRDARSEARIGMRSEWLVNTGLDGPDSASTTIVDWAGLSIPLRMFKDIIYRATLTYRGQQADTVGWGAEIFIRDQDNVVRHEALGPKVTAANVGEGGRTYAWVFQAQTTEFVTLKVSYRRISGTGTGHLQGTGTGGNAKFSIEVVGNDAIE